MWFVVEARAEIVDRVVAVVETEPVLESQVELDAALDGLDPSPLPGWSRVLPDATDRVVFATILRTVASDVALYQPTRDEIDARRTALRVAVGDPRAWDALLQRHSLDEASLGSVIRRRMVVEKLLLRNLVADPADPERWDAECAALVQQLRPRYRVRYVTAQETP